MKTDENIAAAKSTPPIPLSIGQKLKKAREARNLTLDTVAKQLFITKQIVNDLERDDYSKMVAPVYLRGYLSAYARLLQMQVEPLLIEFAKLPIIVEANNKREGEADIATDAMSLPAASGLTFERRNYWMGYMAAIIALVAVTLWFYNHYQRHVAGETLAKGMAISAFSTSASPISPSAVETPSTPLTSSSPPSTSLAPSSSVSSSAATSASSSSSSSSRHKAPNLITTVSMPNNSANASRDKDKLEASEASEASETSEAPEANVASHAEANSGNGDLESQE